MGVGHEAKNAQVIVMKRLLNAKLSRFRKTGGSEECVNQIKSLQILGNKNFY
jgi:hypothetical protein